MIRRRPGGPARFGLVFGGLVALLGGSIGAASQGGRSEALSDVTGVYQNEAPDGGKAIVEDATRAALEDAGLLVRALAKPRILDNNPPFERLVIARRGDEVQVDYEGARSYRAPLDGAAVKQRSPDGSEVEVSYRRRGSTLMEIAQAKEGRAVNTYRREGDELVAETTIESPRLPAPIHFVLRFRRVGEGNGAPPQR
jgi:hypothetical protein